MSANEPYVLFCDDGPKIPVKLLQLHEEGKVVFICGAGISYPAGLPGFHDLTIQIHKRLNHKRTIVEQNLLRAKKYDELLDSLEWNLAKGKISMRQAIFDILQPDLTQPASLETHKALIDLSTLHDDNHYLHLVTTNFDRIFEEVIHQNHLNISKFNAPYLPDPRSSSWNGLVYLHGLLPEHKEDEEALKRLVVTSGDFGLAYLKYGWASQFVTEMQRQYTICFIGYSLSDPVMKYLMDAVSAEKLLGENVNPIYMFCGADSDKEIIEEEKKAIQKIYYSNKNNHSILHKTIQKWANIYRDGLAGKERIIDKNAGKKPSSIDNLDTSTSQVLWTLQTGGLEILNRFSTHDPLPPFEWLELIEKYCCKSYLPEHQWISFGLVCKKYSNFHLEMFPTCIGNWLLRYIDDSRFVLWIIESGGHLSPVFKYNILTYLQQYEEKIKSSQNITKINAHSDIPSNILFKLWYLIIDGKIVSYKRHDDSDYDYSFLSLYLQGNLNPILIQKLRDYFTPKISLHNLWREKLNFPFTWELTLEDNCAELVGETLRNDYQSTLYLLLSPLSNALKDGLDTLMYLDDSNDNVTGFLLNIPSVEEHSQNHTHGAELQVLVDLIRDSWLACSKVDKEKAIIMVKEWISSPYYIFQRLALYAASKNRIISSSTWLEWLLQNNRLWDLNCAREVYRLLATQSKNLSESDFLQLVNTILIGPPKEYFDRKHFTDEDQIWFSNRYIWLRLSKLTEAGCHLPQEAKKTFTALSQKYPEWKIYPNHKEEFSSWCSGTGDPDFESEIEHIFLPRERSGLVEWLIKDINNIKDTYSRRCFGPIDDWQELSKNEPQLALDSLLMLVKNKHWNITRIDETLEAWRDAKDFEHGNRLLYKIINIISDEFCAKIAHGIALYCKDAQKDHVIDEKLLLLIADKLFSISYEDTIPKVMNTYDRYDPVNTSLNHPIGIITLTLLNNCFSDKIKPNEGINNEYRIRFEKLCDCNVLKYRYGRLALTTRSIELYHADPNWAKQYIIPLFDWEHGEFEAMSAWHGFLLNHAIYHPFLRSVKKSCFDLLSYMHNVPKIQKLYISLLFECWFYRVDGYTIKEIKSLIAKLDKKCLLSVAETLAEHQRKTSIKSKDNRFSSENCWEKDIKPIIKIWPHDKKLITDEIRVEFALLIFYSAKSMKEAQRMLEWAVDFLEKANQFIFQIKDSLILSLYPDESLSLIHAFIKNPNWMLRNSLKEILQKIGDANPLLKKKTMYLELEKMTK